MALLVKVVAFKSIWVQSLVPTLEKNGTLPWKLSPNCHVYIEECLCWVFWGQAFGALFLGMLSNFFFPGLGWFRGLGECCWVIVPLCSQPTQSSCYGLMRNINVSMACLLQGTLSHFSTTKFNHPPLSASLLISSKWGHPSEHSTPHD